MIEKDYNLIKIPNIIHMVLHAIPFIKFGFKEDLGAVFIIYGHFSC